VTRERALTALDKAIDFYHDQVADHGGYVWRYSGDLKLREGEAITHGSTIWVQPPGTPTIGEAYLDAYDATRDESHLKAAHDVAEALLRGQLQSGGWNYSIEFDPAKRASQAYRVDLAAGGRKAPGANDNPPAGWEEWKKRKYKGNMTVLDDDTTQAATRFLMRLDRTQAFQDKAVHEATLYALESLLLAQYPNGAWSHQFDRRPSAPPGAETYPVIPASFPTTWSRTWTKDWTGCYRLNDRISLDLIELMLEAHDVYGDPRYLESAKRGGDFLLLAQLPDPQPAWAQQYDSQMQPVWDRKFEPPAITAGESQDALETLLVLYQKTKDARYLKPIPKALAYLNKLALPDGNLARFYEIGTDRPLYFTRDYQLTYSAKDAPKHYGFQISSRLDRIQAEYDRLLKAGPVVKQSKPSASSLAKKVEVILAMQDSRGAFVERGGLDGHEVEPESGIILSETFAKNVRTLAQYLTATATEKSSAKK
jgi:hypothetical protein